MNSVRVLRAFLPALIAAAEDGNEEVAQWLIERMYLEVGGEPNDLAAAIAAEHDLMEVPEAMEYLLS